MRSTWFAFDDGDYSFGDGTVIDGIPQVVGMPGWRKIKKQRGVDNERLRTLMFEIKPLRVCRPRERQSIESDPCQPFFAYLKV